MFTKKNEAEIDAMTDTELDEYIIASRINTKEKVLEQIKAGANTFINNHNGNVEKLKAVVVLDNNYVCLVCINTVCSLNCLYFSEKANMIRLSTSSVSGNFGEFRTNYPSAEEFVKFYVEKFNKEHQDAMDRMGISFDLITEYHIIK